MKDQACLMQQYQHNSCHGRARSLACKDGRLRQLCAMPVVAAGHALGQHQQQLPVTIRKAVTPAELRAAAYLRASSFYTYPPGRSEWAARSHWRMKADSEWASLTAKVEGTEETYRHVVVTPFIATLPEDPGCPITQQVAADMDASSKLPASGEGGGLPSLVVATLDVNQGRNLPAELLQGRHPKPPDVPGAVGGAGAGEQAADWDPSIRRAYLSNVCVASGARRQGLAQRLIREAEMYAAALGVTDLYVHVVHDNEPAIRLYSQVLGFERENEESEQAARSAGRPRRLLLHKRLS